MIEALSRCKYLFFALCLFPAFGTYFYFKIPAPMNQIIYSVSKLLILALPLLFMRRQLRFNNLSRQGLWPSIALGLIISASIFGVYEIFFQDLDDFKSAALLIRGKLYSFNVIDLNQFIILALFISIVNSLFEEYYWRWFLFDLGKKSFSPLSSALILSSCFSIHHFIVLTYYFDNSIWWYSFSFATIIGSLLWCFLYQRQKSFLSIWINHIIIDLGIMMVAYDLLDF